MGPSASDDAGPIQTHQLLAGVVGVGHRLIGAGVGRWQRVGGFDRDNHVIGRRGTFVVGDVQCERVRPRTKGDGHNRVVGILQRYAVLEPVERGYRAIGIGRSAAVEGDDLGAAPTNLHRLIGTGVGDRRLIGGRRLDDHLDRVGRRCALIVGDGEGDDVRTHRQIDIEGWATPRRW